MNEPVVDREVRRRLEVFRRVEEVTGNVAMSCRYFGISRPTYYAWLRRYHDIEISKSGVWRIPHRLDMGRLPTSQRYKRHDRRWTRYEKQRPGTTSTR